MLIKYIHTDEHSLLTKLRIRHFDLCSCCEPLNIYFYIYAPPTELHSHHRLNNKHIDWLNAVVLQFIYVVCKIVFWSVFAESLIQTLVNFWKKRRETWLTSRKWKHNSKLIWRRQNWVNILCQMDKTKSFYHLIILPWQLTRPVRMTTTNESASK